jgi:hypothetical protein
MGIGVVVLTETKFVDDQYPKTAVGYTIMCYKAASCAQGGVTLVWKEDGLKFEVKLGLFHGLNTLTFQLVTGDEQFYIVRMYIPPIERGGWRIYSKRQRRARGAANCSLWGT